MSTSVGYCTAGPGVSLTVPARICRVGTAVGALLESFLAGPPVVLSERRVCGWAVGRIEDAVELTVLARRLGDTASAAFALADRQDPAVREMAVRCVGLAVRIADQLETFSPDEGLGCAIRVRVLAEQLADGPDPAAVGTALGWSRLAALEAAVRDLRTVLPGIRADRLVVEEKVVEEQDDQRG